MNDVSKVPPWLLVLLVLIALTQGTCLFVDARRRGLGKWAWFWGLWGSTTVPMPLLCYWLLVRRDRRKS